MARLTLYGKLPIKNDVAGTDNIPLKLINELEKYYDKSSLSLDGWRVIVNGDLSSAWEKAITVASIDLRIDDNKLSYSIEGEYSAGKWPFWGLLACFIASAIIGYDIIFFIGLGIFGGALVEYVICVIREVPKKYFESAIKKIWFEFGE